jgi:hypothetical protein
VEHLRGEHVAARSAQRGHHPLNLASQHPRLMAIHCNLTSMLVDSPNPSRIQLRNLPRNPGQLLRHLARKCLEHVPNLAPLPQCHHCPLHHMAVSSHHHLQANPPTQRRPRIHQRHANHPKHGRRHLQLRPLFPRLRRPLPPPRARTRDPRPHPLIRSIQQHLLRSIPTQRDPRILPPLAVIRLPIRPDDPTVATEFPARAHAGCGGAVWDRAGEDAG